MPLRPRDSGLIQIMDASLAEAGRRAGHWLACRIGCTQCCHGAFAINALDAERLRAGMEALRASDTGIAEQVARRAQAWIDDHGPAFPGEVESGILGASAEDQRRFEDFANDASCPALDPATGRCDVYAWRPMTCRVFGPPVRVDDGDELGGDALACCELCFVGASDGEIARCEMTVPHELESEILAEMGATAETVVAFALLRYARLPGESAPHDKLGLGSSYTKSPLLGRISTRCFENNYQFLRPWPRRGRNCSPSSRPMPMGTHWLCARRPPYAPGLAGSAQPASRRPLLPANYARPRAFS